MSHLPAITSALRAQFDDDWKYWMAEYPELATAYGYPGQNSRWTDYSGSAIAAREDYLKKSLLRLNAIDRSQIPKEEQLNYDLYRELLETAVEGLAFQNDANPSVFLLSLRAAGTGLNLTTASYVVLYDPWWNPAVEAQAIDRSHRIGQTRTVNAYKLITPGTVEEKIFDLQQRKAQTIADVLGEEGFARNLTKADLEYLFSED